MFLLDFGAKARKKNYRTFGISWQNIRQGLSIGIEINYNSGEKMRKLFQFRYWLVALGLLVSGIVFNSLEADSANLPAPPIVEINATPIWRQDIALSKKYVGYITPIQMVNMTANVTGYIDKILVEGGNEVKKGDKLVIIDQREYKANWLAAQAASAQAKADLENARSYYSRVKKAGTKAYSAADIENYKSKFLAAQAAYKQALANEERAKTTYDYTVINSPIDGVVGNIDLTKGNYISQNNFMFSIVQYDPIRVVFAMTDKDFLQMTQANDTTDLEKEKISLILPDGKIYPHEGKFRYRDNMIDKTTNSLSLYADFANPEKMLIANGYVDVILQKQLSNAILIRQNFAIIKDDGIWAYFIKDGQLKQIKLNVLGEYGNFYAVDNNLGAKDYLVTDKIGDIPANAKIKVKVTPEEKV